MKVGDLVKWSFAEECYYLAFGRSGELHLQRRRGIILDKNPIYFFVRWENGDFNCNKPDSLEVISEGRG